MDCEVGNKQGPISGREIESQVRRQQLGTNITKDKESTAVLDVLAE